MADLKVYSNMYALVNNNLLSEAASIAIRKNPALTPALTLALGFAGAGVGAATCEITIESEVPANDFEFNPDLFMLSGKPCDVGTVMAGRQMQAKMLCTGADYSKSVGSNARMSMTFIGPLAPWE